MGAEGWCCDDENTADTAATATATATAVDASSVASSSVSAVLARKSAHAAELRQWLARMARCEDRYEGRLLKVRARLTQLAHALLAVVPAQPTAAALTAAANLAAEAESTAAVDDSTAAAAAITAAAAGDADVDASASAEHSTTAKVADNMSVAEGETAAGESDAAAAADASAERRTSTAAAEPDSAVATADAVAPAAAGTDTAALASTEASVTAAADDAVEDTREPTYAAQLAAAECRLLPYHAGLSIAFHTLAAEAVWAGYSGAATVRHPPNSGHSSNSTAPSSCKQRAVTEQLGTAAFFVQLGNSATASRSGSSSDCAELCGVDKYAAVPVSGAALQAYKAQTAAAVTAAARAETLARAAAPAVAAAAAAVTPEQAPPNSITTVTDSTTTAASTVVADTNEQQQQQQQLQQQQQQQQQWHTPPGWDDAAVCAASIAEQTARRERAIAALSERDAAAAAGPSQPPTAPLPLLAPAHPPLPPALNSATKPALALLGTAAALHTAQLQPLLSEAEQLRAVLAAQQAQQCAQWQALLVQQSVEAAQHEQTAAAVRTQLTGLLSRVRALRVPQSQPIAPSATASAIATASSGDTDPAAVAAAAAAARAAAAAAAAAHAQKLADWRVSEEQRCVKLAAACHEARCAHLALRSAAAAAAASSAQSQRLQAELSAVLARSSALATAADASAVLRGQAAAEEGRAWLYTEQLLVQLGAALERWEWARDLDSAGMNPLDAARYVQQLVHTLIV
jgi:hypothetical protein